MDLTTPTPNSKEMSSVTDSPRERKPVTKKQLRSLRKLLAPEQYRWFQLGCQMRIPIDKLKKIEREVGRKPPDQCFLGVLNMFFSKNREERKWHYIFEALEDINKRRLMKELKQTYHGGDIVSDDVDIAKLSTLLKDVVPDWYMFGQSLEIPTSDLKALRDEKGSDEYFSRMMDEWMEGEHATFETLIEALEHVGNGQLAREVKEKYLTSTEAPAPVPQPTWCDNIDNGELTYDSDDTHDIVKAVYPVNNWEHLGLALKIKAPILDAIKSDHRGIIADCRYAMIMYWLREGNASWKELCLGLAQEYVGHINLAKQIANQHRISQSTEHLTIYPRQLESILPHPTLDRGEQLPGDKVVAPHGTLVSISPLYISQPSGPFNYPGMIASDSRSLSLEQKTTSKMQEPPHQKYSCAANSSDVFASHHSDVCYNQDNWQISILPHSIVKDLLKKKDYDHSTESTDKTSVLLNSIKGVFGALTELSVDATGLIYHSSQYGITMIIPKGAVETKAIIWIGVCFVSDKFKFENDFIPVSPVVWAYTNSQLIKPAELYIPHHIDISNMEEHNNQLYLLTADDESFLRDEVFTFKCNQEIKMTIESTLANFRPPHFCSNCIGTKDQAYREIPKRYLIAQAERRLSDCSLLVDLCFLFEQEMCKEEVENQYKTLEHNYTLTFLPVSLVSQARLSLSFDPDPASIPGWCLKSELSYKYITEEMIDYYNIFTLSGENGLKMLEKNLLFPPRFKLKFNLTEPLIAPKNYKITIEFIDTRPTAETTVLLENPNGLPYTQMNSSLSPLISLPDISKDTDPYLVKVIDMISAEPLMKVKWFTFGYELDISINQLSIFACRLQDYIQCVREVIIFWRKKNMTETWIPIAQALHFIELHSLEQQIISYFATENTDKLKNYTLCGRSLEETTPLETAVVTDHEKMIHEQDELATLLEEVISKYTSLTRSILLPSTDARLETFYPKLIH